MRKIIALSILISFCMPTQTWAVDLTGAICKKAGQTKQLLGKEYKCVKQGKKKIWRELYIPNKQPYSSVPKEVAEVYSELDKQISTIAGQLSATVPAEVKLISEVPSNERNKPNQDASNKSLQVLRVFKNTMPAYEFYTYQTVGWINSKMEPICPQQAKQTKTDRDVGASVGCGKLVISNLNGWNNTVGQTSASWFEAGHEAFHLAQYHWALKPNNPNDSNWYWGATDWYREGGASVFGAFVGSMMSNLKSTYGDAIAFEGSPYKYNECKRAWDSWQISNEPGGKDFYNNCEYGMGRRMMDLLVAKHGGISAVLNLYEELGKGSNFETAFEKAHGLTLKAFFTEAEAYLDATGWKK